MLLALDYFWIELEIISIAINKGCNFFIILLRKSKPFDIQDKNIEFFYELFINHFIQV